MDERSGERIGWTFGWLGGFLWVAVLAVVVFAQDRLTEAAVGLVLLADALVLIALLAPWRRPDTLYWKLMLPIYVTLFASAAWAIWVFGGAWRRDLSGWNLFLIVPVLLPFGTIGRRRWRDRDIREP